MLETTPISISSDLSSQYFPTMNGTDAARRLFSSFHGLIFRDVPEDFIDSNFTLRVDLRPSIARRRVKLFLGSLEDMAQGLKLDMTSRKYRLSFTKNYRTLMPSDRRTYRLDVLEAAQDGHGALWVNGEKYALGNEVLEAKEQFRVCWFHLLNGLRKIQMEFDTNETKQTECQACMPSQQRQPSSLLNSSSKDAALTPVSSLCQYCTTNWLEKTGLLLIRFDIAWTHFERNYINELIAIEKKSKKLIMDCVYADDELRHYEMVYARLAAASSLPSFTTQDMTLQDKSNMAISDSSDSNQLGNSTNSVLLLTSPATPVRVTDKKNNINSSCSTATTGTLGNYFPTLSIEQDQLDLIAKRINETHNHLVTSIAALNTAANSRRKGRGDYEYSLFERAVYVQEKLRFLRQGQEHDECYLPHTATSALFTINEKCCLETTSNNRSDHDHWERLLTFEQLCGLECLATALLHDLHKVRKYLRHVGEVPERIDPHLCQNHDLVAHLVQLETSWDAAKPHMDTKDSIMRLTNFLNFISNVVDFDLTLHNKILVENDHDNNMTSNQQQDSTYLTPAPPPTCHVNNSNITPINITPANNIALSALNMPLDTKPLSLSRQIEDNNKTLSMTRSTSRDTLEDMITACDVSAFLTLPRLAVLYYLLDPNRDSPNSKLLEFLLPSKFSPQSCSYHLPCSFDIIQKMNTVSKIKNYGNEFSMNNSLNKNHNNFFKKHERPSLVSNQSSLINNQTVPHLPFPIKNILNDTEHKIKSHFNGDEEEISNNLVTGVQFFKLLQELQNTPQYTYILPDCFHRVVFEGAHLADLLFSSSESLLHAEAAWRYILDRCISNSTNSQSYHRHIANLITKMNALDTQIDVFYLALEEASITLQRTNPADWNTFLQIALKCLECLRHPHSIQKPLSTPRCPSNINLQEDEFIQNSPQSARVFESSPIGCRHL